LALIERAAQSSQKWIDEAGLSAECYKSNCYFESPLSHAGVTEVTDLTNFSSHNFRSEVLSRRVSSYSLECWIPTTE
jgi:hypothetical protein